MKQLTLLIKPASSACNMRCRYCFYADEARHRETGNRGIMTKETRDYKVTVDFDTAGTKVMYAAFARLEKIP